MLVDVVLEDNKSRIEHGYVIVQDGFEFGQGRFTSSSVSRNVPIGSVKVLNGVVGGYTSPHDGSLVHLSCNVPDSIIDISVWRSESVWGNTDNISDNFGGPSEFGDNLLVGQSGKGRVRPSVDRDLMARHVFRQEHFRSRKNSGSNDKEGSLEVVLV